MAENQSLFDHPYVNASGTVDVPVPVIRPLDLFPALRIIPWVFALIGIFTLISNGLLFIAYYRSKLLKTPFNIYLINLGIGDFSQALFAIPCHITVMVLYRWPFGHVACQIWMYVLLTVRAAVYNGHILICLNRLWAVMLPVNYKLHHNRKVAVALSIGLWVYVQIWVLAFMFRYSFLNDQPNQRCSFVAVAQQNASLGRVIYALLYAIPEWLVVIIYFIIWVRLKTFWQKCTQNLPLKPTEAALGIANTSSGRSFSVTEESMSGTRLQLLTTRTDSSCPQRQSSVVNCGTKDITNASFRTLTYSVVAASICWTPTAVFYFLLADNPRLFAAGEVLFYLNSCLNPVLYALARKEWLVGLRRTTISKRL